MTEAPAASAVRTWARLWHWQISGTPAAAISPAKGTGSPKESISAAG
jgi:hypothetical protein